MRQLAAKELTPTNLAPMRMTPLNIMPAMKVSFLSVLPAQAAIKEECDARHGHQQCDRRNLHRRQPQVIRKVVDQIRSEDRVGNEIDQAGADDVPDRFQLQDLKIFSEHILDVLCSQDLLLIGILYKARHIGLLMVSAQIKSAAPLAIPTVMPTADQDCSSVLPMPMRKATSTDGNTMPRPFPI